MTLRDRNKVSPLRNYEMNVESKADMQIYNKIELTIGSEDRRFAEFGQDILRVIQKYGDLLIGYDAEDVRADDIVVFCYDADANEAAECIKQLFGDERQKSDTSRDGF